MRRVLASVGIALGVAGLGLNSVGGNPWRAQTVLANDSVVTECPVTHQMLRTQLAAADGADTTGLNNHYWAVVVNRHGVVCAVAFSGASRDSQWLLSRQIAAAKASPRTGSASTPRRFRQRSSIHGSSQERRPIHCSALQPATR